jgi:glutathione peroxidase-family protein
MKERDFLIEKSIQEFKQIESDNRRLIEIAKAMKQEYDEKISYYLEKIKIAEEHLKAYIEPQLSIDEMKETRTEFNLRFPSAKISISKESAKLIKPDVTNCPEEFVKIKKDVDWINYKKELIIQDGQVINKKTGEIADVEFEIIDGGELKLKIL